MKKATPRKPAVSRKRRRDRRWLEWLLNLAGVQGMHLPDELRPACS